MNDVVAAHALLRPFLGEEILGQLFQMAEDGGPLSHQTDQVIKDLEVDKAGALILHRHETLGAERDYHSFLKAVLEGCRLHSRCSSFH